jgi:prepilin-type N-terminal cleavage/methylation domain-containing protein
VRVAGAQPRAGGEAGFTLIELLVAMAAALIVVIGPTLFIVTSIHQQNSISSRAVAARQAETGLERMVRDLREAMTQDASGNALSVTVSNPTTTTTAISFNIPTPGSATTPQPLVWTCPSSGATSAASCTRKLGSTGSAKPVITGVNSATFSAVSSSGGSLTLPATNPGYVNISLSVRATSQLDTTQTHAATGDANPILVQTGVDLRNLS